MHRIGSKLTYSNRRGEKNSRPGRRPSLSLVIALAALAVAVFGTVQGSWAAGSKAVKPTPTVVATVTERVPIASGSVQIVEAKCPAGYTVIGGSYSVEGSVLTHASVAAASSVLNSYSVEFVNPPANPLAGLPEEEALGFAGAICAKNSTPIVVNGAFPHK
jgi:hypothetical protein